VSVDFVFSLTGTMRILTEGGQIFNKLLHCGTHPHVVCFYRRRQCESCQGRSPFIVLHMPSNLFRLDMIFQIRIISAH